MSLNKNVVSIYNKDEKQTLLNVAYSSIENGFDTKHASIIDIVNYSGNLLLERATFVTLYLNDELRGCIGNLVARHSLIQSIANNAYAAAFQDPRFSPVTPAELKSINLSLSILSLPEPISFNSEEDLILQIRPGIDGLILQDGFKRGTFLPSVWSSLPDVKTFLQHLKQKADLPENYWSDTIQVERYTTEVVE